jgi:3-deoxy-D-manno-octulosonic-acid transferase
MDPSLKKIIPQKAPFSQRGWFIFYNLLVVPLLFVAFHVAAWFSPKIRAGIKGRARWWNELARQLRAISPQRPRVWIHAASMGEYEQARPIIREIKQRMPECVIILSFFSPSAFDHVQKNLTLAEVVCYLPFDSLQRARRFLRIVQPDAGIFIRHDLWPNHLWLARKRGIFLMLASASVHEKSLRHKPLLRSFNRAVFGCFDVVGAISKNAAAGLEKFVPHERNERLSVIGDTRYDQVLFRSLEKKLDGVLPEGWRGGEKTFIAGSVWPEDAAVALPAFAAARAQIAGLRMMIVPHEPTPVHVREIEGQCAALGLPAVSLSQWREDDAVTVLIVDRIGILANLYGVGQVAFVGGSFGPGIHNILEAAVHGVPVLFGPVMRNSAEAIAMMEAGIARVIHDAGEGEQALLKFFRDENHRRQLAEQNRAFVLERCGASARLVKLLQEALHKRQKVVYAEVLHP